MPEGRAGQEVAIVYPAGPVAGETAKVRRILGGMDVELGEARREVRQRLGEWFPGANPIELNEVVGTDYAAFSRSPSKRVVRQSDRSRDAHRQFVFAR